MGPKMMANQLVQCIARQSRSRITPLVTQVRGAHDHHAVEDPIKVAIGNREVVGFGMNGQPNYIDRVDFPMPAIRYKEVTADIQVLKDKEKGDWKSLTMEEKKALYRASFCQTFAEMKAPTGEWKSILAAIFTALAATGWIIIFMKKCVYSEMPITITREWQEDQMNRMIRQGQNRVEGVSSLYDY